MARCCIPDHDSFSLSGPLIMWQYGCSSDPALQPDQVLNACAYLSSLVRLSGPFTILILRGENIITYFETLTHPMRTPSTYYNNLKPGSYNTANINKKTTTGRTWTSSIPTRRKWFWPRGGGYVNVVKSGSEKGLDSNSIGEDHTTWLLAVVHGRL